MNEESGFERLSELAMGFQDSRIFLSALELDVFTAIGSKSLSASDVAAAAGSDVRGMDILLNALVGLGLLTKSGELFANTPLTAKFLVAGSPDYAGVGLKHSANLWRSWSTLTDVVRTGQVGPRPSMDTEEARAWLDSFIMLMHNRAKYRAPKVADALDPTRFRAVLDLGGGPGTHSIEFASRNTDLCAVVFDLPEVTLIAQRIINEAGMQDRVVVKQGDYFVEDFGQGYDLVFLSAIIHSNSPEGNKRIFSKAYDSLIPGGQIAVVDFIMDEQKTSPPFGAIFAVNMLVNTEGGNCYSETEIRQWLTETGFVNPSLKREIDEDISLMTAAKP